MNDILRKKFHLEMEMEAVIMRMHSNIWTEQVGWIM